MVGLCNCIVVATNSIILIHIYRIAIVVRQRRADIVSRSPSRIPFRPRWTDLEEAEIHS